MNGYFDRFGAELVQAAYRRQRRPWVFSAVRGRGGWRPVALAAAVVVAVGLALVLTVGRGTDRRSAPIADPQPPARSAPPAVAGGGSDRGRWQLVAAPCAGGGVRLTLEEPDGAARSRCAKPRRGVTVNERYARTLGSTFVYGVTSERVDEVELKLSKRKLRVRTRPAPAEPSQPRSELRVYVARLPGESNAKEVVPYAGGRAIDQPTPARAPDDEQRAPDRGRPGSGSSAPDKPRRAPRSRPRAAPPAGVVLKSGATPAGAWRVVAEPCSGTRRPDRVVFTPFAEGQPPSGARCDDARFPPGQPKYVSAYDSYLPSLDVTVVAGYVHADVTLVKVGFRDGHVVELAPSGSRAQTLPPDLLFYAVAVPGRREFLGTAVWADGRVLACVRRCVGVSRKPEPQPGAEG
jgi:hypothetical protein